MANKNETAALLASARRILAAPAVGVPTNAAKREYRRVVAGLREHLDDPEISEFVDSLKAGQE